MKPDPHIKQRYNLAYKARKKGFKVNGYKKKIFIRFEQITAIINTNETMLLIKVHGFIVVQDKQLTLF